MRPRSSTRSRPALAVGLLLLATLLLVGPPAAAQAIKVTSAVPDTTDQGVVGLVVTVGGENFGSNSRVAFYVTGTKNPGGIAVKSVKFKDSRTLDATIDVAPDAQTDLKFDIEVKSGSRTGKGTELFKVNVKITGGDKTPPGTVSDLQLIESGFNTVRIGWTEPADDGFDVSSGPASQHDMRVRRCGEFTSDLWALDGATWMRTDPCAVNRVYTGTPGAPLSAANLRLTGLAPDTEYWFALRHADDAPQGINWSSPSEPQLWFRTGPFPPGGLTAPWDTQIVDYCALTDVTCHVDGGVRLGFDVWTGDPLLLYDKNNGATLASWDGLAGTWTSDLLPVAIDTGNYWYDFGVDPTNGELSIATIVRGSRTNELNYYRRVGTAWQTETIATGTVTRPALGLAPGSGTPTVAYEYTKGGSTSLRVARRLSASWTIETVAPSAPATNSKGALARPVLFDLQGNPAVTFTQKLGDATRLAFGIRSGGGWAVELPDDQSPGAPWVVNESAMAFDPSRNVFAAAARFYNPDTQESLIRICQRAPAAGWSCDTAGGGRQVSNLNLTIDGAGTVLLSYLEQLNFFMRVRAPGSTEWVTECVDWSVRTSIYGDMKTGPDGKPVIAYDGANDPNGTRNNTLNIAIRW